MARAGARIERERRREIPHTGTAELNQTDSIQHDRPNFQDSINQFNIPTQCGTRS